jgi:predicted RNase H-like HicB family nuclease
VKLRPIENNVTPNPSIEGDVHKQASLACGRPSCQTLGFSTRTRDNCPFALLGVKMLLTAVLIPSAEGGFTALNPETGTTSQGETVEESLANLQEATELYLEEFPLKTSGQPLVTTFQVTVNA